MGVGINVFRSEVAHVLPINIWSSCSGSLYFPDPRNDGTSANKLLLDIYDPSPSSGKVTFIPIDFLRNVVGHTNTYFDNEIDEKKFLVGEFKKGRHIDNTYLSTQKYKDVPLSYFRKPLCRSNFSYCGDSLIINRTRHGDEWENMGVDVSLIPKNPKKTYHLTKDEWMYLDQIAHHISIMSKSLKENLVTILPPYYDGVNMSYINSNKPTRFYVGIILHNSHFTSYFIDTLCYGKTTAKKNIYFFDSCGFDGNNFNPHSSYRFIGSDMTYGRSHKGSTTSKTSVYDKLFQHFDKTFGLTHAFFNTYKIQHLSSECGMFASSFLHQFFHQLTKNSNKWDARLGIHAYYCMANIGNDLMMSWIKSSHFVTRSDLSTWGLTEQKYKNSIGVYPLANKTFLEFQNVYSKWAKQFNALNNH